MSLWLDNSSNSNNIKQSYVHGFLDISGGNVNIRANNNLNIFSETDTTTSRFTLSSDEIRVYDDNTSSFVDLSNNKLQYIKDVNENVQTRLTDLTSRTQKIRTTTGGEIEVSANIIPNVASAIDLGSETKPFKSLYLNDSTLYFVGSGDNATAASFSIDDEGEVYVNKGSANERKLTNQSKKDNNKTKIGHDMTPASDGITLDMSGIALFRNDVRINGHLNVDGSINFLGEFIQKDTVITVTEQMDLSNDGTGPALIVRQHGSQAIASFYDDGDVAMIINDGGDVSMNMNLNVGGNAEIDGSTTIKGVAALNSTLTVSKTATLNSNAIVSGDVSMNSNLNVGGNAEINGSTTITGIAALNSTLTVSNTATMNSNAIVSGDVSINSNLNIGGNAEINGSTTITGVAALNSTLTVSNTATMNSNAIVSGDVSINSNLNIGGNAEINGSTTITGAMELNSTLTVSNTATLNSNAIVSGDVSMNSNLNVGGNAEIDGSTTITGVAALNSTLTVSNTATMNSNAIVSGDVSMNSKLSVGDDVSFNNDVDIAGDLKVSGNISGTFADNSIPSSAISGGASSINVSVINTDGDISNQLTASTLRFDTDSGFALDDLSNGVVKVKMNSTFKYWNVEGQDTLIAEGLDTMDFFTDGNIQIVTDGSDANHITFKAPNMVDSSANQDISGIKTFQQIFVYDDVCLNSNLNVIGNADISGTLDVAGDITGVTDLIVTGYSYLDDVATTGNVGIKTNDEAAYELEVNGTAYATDISAGNSIKVGLTTISSNSTNLAGAPTTTTATSGTNNTQIATTAFVQTAVANLLDSAPETLNTLNELAAALGDDASFSTTITTRLGKVDVSVNALEYTTATHTSEISVLDTSVNDLESTTATHTSNISILDASVNALENTTATHTSEISVLDTSVNALENTTATHTSEISVLDTSVNALENTTATHTSEISVLDTSVNALENTTATHTSEISVLDTSVNDLESTTATHTSNISILDASVNALENTTATHTSNISILDASVNALENTTATHTSEISVLDTSVNALESTTVTHTSNISILDTSVNDLESATATHTSNISILDVSVNALESTTATHTSDISVLDTSVNVLESTTVTNTSDISTINNTVTDLSGDVYDMSSNFTTRARAAFSASTGVTIAEGVISIPQEIETTSSVQFGGITVNGDAYATDISTGSLIVDNLTLDNNTITTPSNTHLLLQPGGSNDGNERVVVKGDLWVDGSINFSGDMIQTNTNVQVTDQLDISNTGTGPALIARQYGAEPIAQFYDDANLAMEIMDGGDVSMVNGLTVGNMQVRQSGTNYYLGHSGSAASNSKYAVRQSSSTGATYINTGGSNLRFAQNGNAKMVMTTNGLALNEGNGPTSGYKLDVAGDVLFQNDLDVSSIDVSNNINLNANSSAITLWGNNELYSISMRSSTVNGGSFPYGIQGFATKFSMTGNMGWVFTTAGSGVVSNNNTAMSIRGDGLTHIKGPLGIGVDPSASAWNDYSLSVSQGMRVGYPGGTSSTASGMGFIKITGESAGGSAGLFFGIHNSEDSAHKGAIIFDSGQNVTGGGNGRGDMHFCTTDGTTNVDVTPSSNAQMTIRRTGNIGIHTTDPRYTLDVNGTAYATDISAGNSIKIGATSITDDILTTDISANSLAIGNGYTKFTVDSAGATSIASTLTVAGNTNLNGLLNLGPIGSEGGEIRFDNGSGAVRWFMDVDGQERMRIRHNTSGKSYGIYILKTGNVGIGTQDPSVALEIISTDAIRIPKGTTEQRPTGLDGMIRYNITSGNYEGWSGGASDGEWGSLGGTNSVATTSADGLMSYSDKTKLDGIATNANNYTLPEATENTLGGVKVGDNLSINNGVLSATDTDTTYNNATTSADGLMSYSDKSKLDGIDTSANNYSLPIASSSILGGVKVGTNSNISIASGVISIPQAIGPNSSPSFNNLTVHDAYMGDAGFTNSQAVFCHKNFENSNTDCAFRQTSEGDTIVNTQTDHKIWFRHNNNNDIMTLSGSNVGIGITNPTYNLHVAGTAHVSTSLSVGTDLTVTGNLTVNGTTTTLNTENLDVSDSLIGLSKGLTGSPGNDAGILINRGDVSNVFIGWDESADKFTMGTTLATSSSTGNLSITKGTLVADLEGDVTGNLTGNAETVTNGVYTTSSVTALFDVSSVGSGEIITTAERSKLNGIESGANVTDAANVSAAGAVMTSGNQNITGAKAFSDLRIKNEEYLTLYKSTSGPADRYSIGMSNTAGGTGKGFSSWTTRFRMMDNSSFGFLFTNDSSDCLVSIRASDGLTYINGNTGIGFDPTEASYSSYKLSVNGKAYVDGDVSLNSNLTVAGNAYANDLILSGKITLTGGDITSDTNSSFFDGSDSLLTLNGFMYAKAILNYGEDGDGTTGLVFGTDSSYNTDKISFITNGNTRMFINDNGVGIGTTSPNVKLEIISTDAIRIPKGTTEQRPTGLDGMIRYNTTTGGYEGWSGGANTGEWGSLGGTNSVATTSADGLMSYSDKTKLDGIDDNANNYSLPIASSSILGGVKVGDNLSINNGVLSATDTDTTYNNATTSAAGLMSSDDKSKLDDIATNANNYSLPIASSSILGGVKVGNNLSISNGVLSATDTDTTYNNATTSAAGLMSSDDKSKLDDIATNANNYSLPIASSSILGGVKVGTNSNISIASGVISIPQAIGPNNSPSFTNLTLSGNLTVNGTTTTLNTENLDVSDSLIGLSKGLTGSPGNDAGILINRGSSDNVFMGWDESAGNFTMGTTLATSSSTGNLSITKGTLVADLEGDVTGNLTGNATTVSNGVYTTGNQTIGGTKTFTSAMTHIGSIPTANQTSTNNALSNQRMFVGYNGDTHSGILMGSINGNAPYISSTIRGDGSNTTSKLRIYNAKTIAIETLNGDVGIGKEGPAYKLDVNGTAYASDISAGNSIKVGQSIITTNTIPNIDSSINTMESKLNGIESGADVTDATNVSAAGAVMTSGDQSISGSKTFSVLNVTGDVSFNSDLAVAGEISANTLGIGSDYTKFTVDSDGNVNIKGTLTIEGTGSSGNVASLDINDNIISIANGSSEEGYDAGLYITRTGTDQFFGYDNDASKFILGGVSSGSSSSNSISVNTGTLVANIEGNLIDGTTATTQSSGDNTTKVATTAFVNNAVSSTSYSGGNGISVSGTTISLSSQTDTSFSKIDTSFSDIYNWTTDDIAEGSTNKYATESSILTLIGQGLNTTNDVEFKSLTITDSNSGDDVNAVSLYNTAGTNNDSSVSIKFYDHPTVETGTISNYRYDSGDYGLKFKNWYSGSNSEHMVLRKGSVGIGTNDPGYKLEVNGSAAANTLVIGSTKTEFSVTSSGATSIASTLNVAGDTTINANLIIPSSTVVIGKTSTTSSGDYGDISSSDYDKIALDVSGSVRYDVSNTRVYFLNKWGSHQYGTSVYWNMSFINTSGSSNNTESLEQSNNANFSNNPEKKFGHKDYSWSNEHYNQTDEFINEVEFEENTVMSIMDPINHNLISFKFRSTYSDTGASGTSGNAGSISIGLFCENAIVSASKMFIFSDRRIKKNITSIQDDQALQDLRKLNPCIYNYIDVAKKGVSTVYGFIAQEVEEVLPYACSKKNEFIPNVYNMADISGNLLILRNGTFNDLSLNITNTITQNKSAILSLSNENESLNRYIKQIVNDTTIELFEPITTDESIYDASLNKYGIFIYGQYVNDLTVLDKNAIWTVAAAATQEIDRQQQADKVRIAELETKVETLESQLASVLARLTALENA